MAFALHVGVVGLIVYAAAPPDLIEMPPRVSVNLASEVSLEATAPRIAPDSRAALGPQIADTSAPAIEEAPEETSPEESAPPPPPPETRNPVQQETTPPRDRPRERPDRQKEAETEQVKDGGGTLLDEDFAKGFSDNPDSENDGPPAVVIGEREKAALRQRIDRQLKPHWQAPNGIDAERLVSLVSWRMNEDGSLRGTPTCQTIRRTITNSNRPQAALHCERAIRAVRKAAPFRLPAKFYDEWKSVKNWRLSKES